MVVRQSAVAAAVASSAIVVVGSGGVSLLGLLLAGGLVASWGYVYARILCAAAPFDWSRMLRTAAAGALAMPAITVIAWLAGSGVWLLAVGVALVCIPVVTPDGRRSPSGAGSHLTTGSRALLAIPNEPLTARLARMGNVRR